MHQSSDYEILEPGKFKLKKKSIRFGLENF